MWKLLIGPALLGAIHLGGGFNAADARQVVHKRPSVTYAAVSQAISGARQKGVMRIEGGKPGRR